MLFTSSKSLIEYTFIRYTLLIYNNDLDTINSNSRYNPETDALDIYYNGEIVGSLNCSFQTFNYIKTVSGDWSLSNATVSISSDAITFRGVAGTGYSIICNVTASNVNGGKKLYYNSSDSDLFSPFTIYVSTDKVNWTEVVIFSGGKAVSGSVSLPIGNLYIKLSGYCSNTKPAVFSVLEIR